MGRIRSVFPCPNILGMSCCRTNLAGMNVPFFTENQGCCLGLGPWSWVVLKDKITVLGPGLGLEA